MKPMITLPAPYTAHPGHLDDLMDIWHLLVAVSMAEAGTPGFGCDEVENWLTGFPIVIAEDVVTIRDDAGLVVGLEVFHMRDPYVRPIAIGGVHPDHTGLGLGTALFGWALQQAANLCDAASEGDEEVGHVATLGVLREHRRAGLGRALLLTAFNAFFDRGKRGASLGVDADSLTGATRLYESVGMRSGAKYGTWEIEIRPGVDLATADVSED